MKTTRLEAFSDGVIAIIITIMVLEIKVPHGDTPAALVPLIPVFLSYVLSFIYVGIYWNNHHHLMHIVCRVNGKTLWANLHLLFWLSMVPVTTGWLGENHVSEWPVALYGVSLLMTAFAWMILTTVAKQDPLNAELMKTIGVDPKARLSLVFYVSGVVLSFVQPWLGILMYVVVAIMWLIPDQRIERALENDEHEDD